MPIIKPISDLRNKASSLSELVHKSDEPIFITKNGEGDMVLMSLAHYGKLERRLESYEKLAVAEAQAAAGDSGLTQPCHEGPEGSPPCDQIRSSFGCSPSPSKISVT